VQARTCCSAFPLPFCAAELRGGMAPTQAQQASYTRNTSLQASKDEGAGNATKTELLLRPLAAAEHAPPDAAAAGEAPNT
jgi:hypothetical protein